MYPKKHDLTADVQRALDARPGNRLTLVAVADASDETPTPQRIVTLRCKCGECRTVHYRRILDRRRYPVFACLECTRLIGYRADGSPRRRLTAITARRMILLLKEARSVQG